MSKHLHSSNSEVQLNAHSSILKIFNHQKKTKLISVDDYSIEGKHFQVDGYSENPPILCEIFARIGKMKSAQRDKVCKDILKMLLIEKLSNKKFKKYIVFADSETYNSFLTEKSWYQGLNNAIGIEFYFVNLSKSLKQKIKAAQIKQYR